MIQKNMNLNLILETNNIKKFSKNLKTNKKRTKNKENKFYTKKFNIDDDDDDDDDDNSNNITTSKLSSSATMTKTTITTATTTLLSPLSSISSTLSKNNVGMVSKSSFSSSSSSSSNFTTTYSHTLAGIRYLYAGILVISLLMGNVNAKIGYFWHITDLHLDSFYSTKGDVLKSCWRIEHHQTSTPGRTPGRFGDYLCDSPWSLLESATLAMKSRQGDNVEFVLWTGDGLSHSAHRILETHRLEILRNITELLGRTFSSQFVFPVLGHEDGSNTNFHRLGELWRHWLPSEALQTFEKGGYYTIEQTKSRLRIIALNTNFMRHDTKYSQSQLAAVRQRQLLNPLGSMSLDSTEYKNYYYHHGGGHRSYPSDINSGIGGYSASYSHYGNNYYGVGYSGGSGGAGSISGSSNIGGSSSGGSNNYHNNPGGVAGGGQVSALSGYDNHETQKQWDWLEDVLAKSKSNKETVYIVGHIPPGSDERFFGSQQNGHTTFTDKNNLRYLRLVRKYSSIIQGQFFGHLHSDSFRIIYNDMGKPVSWIMISPSVTPRKMSVGSNNPAMRLYKFDTDSGQVLDYTQYYLDLAAANSIGEANWMPEYNMTTHYYGLAEISAVSLHNLAERFTNSENPSFAKYYRANSVRYLTQSCEGVCVLNHYCAITRVDYREFRECLETAASALASNSIKLQSNINSLLCTQLLSSIFSIIYIIKNFIKTTFICNKIKSITINVIKLIKHSLNSIKIIIIIFHNMLILMDFVKTIKRNIKNKNNNENNNCDMESVCEQQNERQLHEQQKQEKQQQQQQQQEHQKEQETNNNNNNNNQIQHKKQNNFYTIFFTTDTTAIKTITTTNNRTTTTHYTSTPNTAATIPPTTNTITTPPTTCICKTHEPWLSQK